MGDYVYSFDWKCNGEFRYDYLRAALVPAYTVLTPGHPSGFDGNEVPEGSIALDNNQQLNLSTTWQNQQGVFHLVTPGNYLLVFMWRNNIGAYHQTPAAIDNILIEPSDGLPARPRHVVAVDVNNAEYGIVTGAGLYYYGDTAILAAIPYDDYFFYQWSDGDTNNPRNLIVTGDTALMAIFQQVEGIDVVQMDGCKVYPNPTNGKVTIATTGHLVAVYLTDMMGRRNEVTVTATGDGLYSFDISSFPQAVFLLTVITADGQQHTVRLLKQTGVFAQ